MECDQYILGYYQWHFACFEKFHLSSNRNSNLFRQGMRNWSFAWCCAVKILSECFQPYSNLMATIKAAGKRTEPQINFAMNENKFKLILNFDFVYTNKHCINIFHSPNNFSIFNALSLIILNQNRFCFASKQFFFLHSLRILKRVENAVNFLLRVDLV